MQVATIETQSSPSSTQRGIKKKPAVHMDKAATGHIGPSTLLTPEARARLMRLRPAKLACCLAVDFGLIALTVLLCEYFSSPFVYILGVMLIGGRQAGIGDIGLHHGVHRTLLRNRTLNDLLGKTLSLMVFSSIISGYDAYRRHHLDHHRDTNTHDDPDHEYFDKVYQMPRWKAALLLALPLTGVLFLLAVANYLRENWRSKPLTVLTVSIGILLLGVGCYLGNYPIRLLVAYWFVPIMTWGVFANQLRALAEHYPAAEYHSGDDVPDVFRTREIINSWFDQCFLVTRGLNYHLSHHLCSQVPFYSMRDLQSELAKSPTYAKYAHVTHGYHRFLFEFFGKRNVERGVHADLDRATNAVCAG